MLLPIGSGHHHGVAGELVLPDHALQHSLLGYLDNRSVGIEQLIPEDEILLVAIGIREHRIPIPDHSFKGI